MAQINKPNLYFNTKLYTGNGTDNHSITGLDFQPDWVWIKERDDINAHYIFDSVRGVDKQLQSNSDAAEYDYSGDPGRTLKSFDSDGFTLGTGAGVNGSGELFASWNWLASNTTASNTDGSITSTVSANTTSGFSIVSYTGTGSNATVGHGLGIAPKFLIVKAKDAIRYWAVQTSTGAGFEMNLNVAEAQTATSVYWNSTDPTSSVFSVGTNAATNNSGDDYIAYVFAPIKGFSKFGSYTGNGNADGTFIYTGFKPGFFMLKNIDAAESWTIRDTKRTPYNVGTVDIFPNLTNAETTSGGSNFYDILSNGVKLRGADARQNQSGQNYIYMAFAESPLVGTNNIPATAR
jgi:hypothetical protein